MDTRLLLKAGKKMDWIFDGIGTEIIGMAISLIVGALGGGTLGYKIGIKRTSQQKQTANDYAVQKQKLHIGQESAKESFVKNKTNMKQFQKAANNATQIQIGGIDDDCR